MIGNELSRVQKLKHNYRDPRLFCQQTPPPNRALISKGKQSDMFRTILAASGAGKKEGIKSPQENLLFRLKLELFVF